MLAKRKFLKKNLDFNFFIRIFASRNNRSCDCEGEGSRKQLTYKQHSGLLPAYPPFTLWYKVAVRFFNLKLYKI